MSSYVLMTDSTCDITQEMADTLNIDVIPLSFMMGGKSYANYLDGREMKTRLFYEKLRQGETSTTTQINTEEFMDKFNPILESGKDILYIAFSSGLSGTCQGAMLSAKRLAENYPDRRIEVFDSLCASMGQGLLVYHAAKRWRSGATMDELLLFLSETRLKLAHWFTVEDLNHLKRGGRLSAGAALVGTMLGIKPVLHVNDSGHLTPVTKVRGRKQSLDALVKKMEEAVNPQDQTVFISHGDSLVDAQYVEREIKDKYKVKEIYLNYIGPVIGAHAGPGTIALFFLAKER